MLKIRDSVTINLVLNPTLAGEYYDLSICIFHNRGAKNVLSEIEHVLFIKSPYNTNADPLDILKFLVLQTHLIKGDNKESLIRCLTIIFETEQFWFENLPYRLREIKDTLNIVGWNQQNYTLK